MCVQLRGLENGGRVEGVLSGDLDRWPEDSPGEYAISEGQLLQLEKLGLCPLVNMLHSNCAVFSSDFTAHRPNVYIENDATALARLEATLGIKMLISRFAHYVRLMAQQMYWVMQYSAADLQGALNHWLADYATAESVPAEDRVRRPLLDARLDVHASPEPEGDLRLVLYLRPYYRCHDILVGSFRIVVVVPRPL